MAKVRQFKPEDIKRRDTTRRVMNKTSDIRSKMESVNKYSLCGVSGLGFPGVFKTRLSTCCSQPW